MAQTLLALLAGHAVLLWSGELDEFSPLEPAAAATPVERLAGWADAGLAERIVMEVCRPICAAAALALFPPLSDFILLDIGKAWIPCSNNTCTLLSV
jgi:hypothetical protein